MDRYFWMTSHYTNNFKNYKQGNQPKCDNDCSKINYSGADNMHFWVNRANRDTITKVGMPHLHSHDINFSDCPFENPRWRPFSKMAISKSIYFIKLDLHRWINRFWCQNIRPLMFWGCWIHLWMFLDDHTKTYCTFQALCCHNNNILGKRSSQRSLDYVTLIDKVGPIVSVNQSLCIMRSHQYYETPWL